MKSFHAKDYDKNRIVIDIDIITLCNYHCWYCYARKETELWNKIMPISTIKAICKRIEKYKGIVDINILGGEPSLHPNLKEVLHEFSKLNNVDDVTITTNASKDKLLKLLKALDVSDKVRLNLSFHPSEVDSAEFYEKLDLYYNTNRLDLITIMVNKDYVQETNDLMKLQELYPDVIFDQTFPYVNGDVETTETDTDFNKIYVIDDDTLHPYGYNEVLEYKYNRFKGWKCNVNRFGIKVNGDVIANCKKLRINARDIDFNEHKCIVCAYEECFETCILETLKEKV